MEYFLNVLPEKACRTGNEPALWEDGPGTILAKPGWPLPISWGTPQALMEQNPLPMCHSLFSKLLLGRSQVPSSWIRRAAPRAGSFMTMTETFQTYDTPDWGRVLNFGLETQETNDLALHVMNRGVESLNCPHVLCLILDESNLGASAAQTNSGYWKEISCMHVYTEKQVEHLKIITTGKIATEPKNYVS